MVSFEVDQKFVDTFRKNTDSTQAPHVGSDMHRVQSLLVDSDIENFRQLVCAGVKNIVLKIVLRDDCTVVPQCFR